MKEEEAVHIDQLRDIRADDVGDPWLNFGGGSQPERDGDDTGVLTALTPPLVFACRAPKQVLCVGSHMQVSQGLWQLVAITSSISQMRRLRCYDAKFQELKNKGLLSKHSRTNTLAPNWLLSVDLDLFSCQLCRASSNR